MIKNIKSYFRNPSLWIQVVAGLIITTKIWIISVIYGMVKGLGFNSAIENSLGILSAKISLWQVIVLAFIFILILSYLHRNTTAKQKQYSYSKQILDSKIEFIQKDLKNKIGMSDFKNFVDVYNYRRLKNHPYHEQYSHDEVDFFINLIQEGNKKSNKYDLEVGMTGLISELKEKKSIHSSDKNRVKEEMKKKFTDQFIYQKEELNNILNSMQVY